MVIVTFPVSTQPLYVRYPQSTLDVNIYYSVLSNDFLNSSKQILIGLSHHMIE